MTLHSEAWRSRSIVPLIINSDNNLSLMVILTLRSF